VSRYIRARGPGNGFSRRAGMHRSSEILALRWSDILWGEGRMRISKRWAKGEDGETKTDASDGYVPLHLVLAGHVRAWRRQTPHAKTDDFVLPSIREKGRRPLYACSFVADHLPSKPECKLQTGEVRGFTTYVTA
jgi:integrase